MNVTPAGRQRCLLRRPGPPAADGRQVGVQIADPRLARVIAPDAELLVLHEGAVHAEGPVWQTSHRRLLFSDVPNRRLNAWYEDGHVEALLDNTHFLNGNAIAADGSIYHCEHGRRCLSRSWPELHGDPEPVVTQFEGRRLNSPNDVVVGPDGCAWFTDPVFGISMPSQGCLADAELDHRSVYRFNPLTDELSKMADFDQPNGLAFSPDQRTLYVSDTSLALGEVPGREPGAKHEIEAFDVGVGGLLSRRRFFCRADQGYPDGFKVDIRGWVWTSAGSGIDIWSEAGDKLGRLPIEGTVANLAFGVGGKRLFIAASTRLLAVDLRG